MSQRFRSSSEEERRELESEWNIFFEQEEKEEKFQHAERRFLQSKALYYQMLGNIEGVLNYFRKVIDWWDKNVSFREEEFYRYMQDVSNLLYAYQANKDFQNSQELLDDFRKNKPKHYHEERVWKEITYHYELLQLLNKENQEAEKARMLVEEIEEGIIVYNLKNNLVITGNVGILHFINGDFEKSQKWLSKIIVQSKLNVRKDVQYLARLLNLINLYEVGEIEEVDNFYRTTYRFFRKNKLEKDSIPMQILSKLISIFKSDYNKARTEKAALGFFLEENKHHKLLAETLLYWVKSETMV